MVSAHFLLVCSSLLVHLALCERRGSLSEGHTTIISVDTRGIPRRTRESETCNNHPMGRKGFSMEVLSSGFLILFGGKTKLADAGNRDAFDRWVAKKTLFAADQEALTQQPSNTTAAHLKQVAKNAKDAALEAYDHITRTTFNLPSSWDGHPPQVLNDLWAVSLSEKTPKWKQVLAWRPGYNSSTAPETLWKTSSASLNDKMLVYGGCPCLDSGCNFSSTIWSLNADGASKVTQTGLVRGVRGAELIATSSSLIALGGKINSTTCSKGVYATSLLSSDAATGWEELPSYPGECRWGFSAEKALIGNNENVIIFGGRAENYTDSNPLTNHRYFNDVLLFDTKTKAWKLQPKTQPWPTPRNHMGMSVINNQLYVFGGRVSLTAFNLPSDQLWRYNIEANSWTPLTPHGSRPAGRFGHATALWGESMVLFGGESLKITKKSGLKIWVTDEYLNDIWVYNTKSNRWNEINTACGKLEPTTIDLAFNELVDARNNDSIMNDQDEDGPRNILIISAAIGLTTGIAMFAYQLVTRR